jgi:phosphoglycolate phosphatase
MLADSQRISSARFVATSKPTIYAKRIVSRFNLDGYFTDTYGAELDARFDDKADLLAHLLAAEGVTQQDAVMIGDRSADVLAAKANGIRSVGVLWGYGSDDELAEAGADLLCATPSELMDCLARLAI